MVNCNKFLRWGITLRDIILKPVQENLCLFICFYLTGLVLIILPVVMHHETLLKTSFFTWIFDIYIICLLLQLFPSKIKKWISILIAVPFYILAIVDVFCYKTHDAKFNPEILNLILDTNNREANEYLAQYIQPGLFLTPIGIILVIIILHLLMGRYKKYLVSKLSQLRLGSILKSITVLLVIVSIVLSLPSRFEFVKILGAKSKTDIGEHISFQVLNTPCNNLLFGMKLRELDKQELVLLLEAQKQVKVDSCSFEPSEIVFIIGESYIKSHSQLYGYSKETTPLQKQRTTDVGNGLLIPFTDVVTMSNYTSHVFKNAFSLKSVEDDKIGKASIFPVLFKKAGYHVTFISSQFFNNSDYDVFDLSGGLFLNNASLSSMAFDCRNEKAPRYDETLLEYYDSLKIYNRKYNLTIFHLIGQHIDFYKRSPKEWKKFQVKDYQDRKDINDKEKAFVADYDNATLYNDYVVDQIIKRFEDKDAIVIYMPDHGEGCYDGGHKLGRMPKGEYSRNILENEYDIPFWIWCSKQYLENHPQICQQIKDAQNRPFMTDDIPHLLLYLGGIKCQEYQEKKNLISPIYDVHRKRLLNGEADYDSIISRE